MVKFLEYVTAKREEVWFARRDEIASHWYSNFYPEGHGEPPKVPLIGQMNATL